MYKRILLKFSGEALLGKKQYGVDGDVLSSISQDIVNLIGKGYEIGVVIGAGNICRGAGLQSEGVSRGKADQIGMLATVMNSIRLQESLRSFGVASAMMSATRMDTICDIFSATDAINLMKAGNVVIFAGGTGSPFFTTDTAAVLRGAEIGADIVIKCTKVDGIFTADPSIDKNAKLLKNVTYEDALSMKLMIMDATAMALAMQTRMPIMVCSMKKFALQNALNNDGVFTLVS